MSGVRLVTNLYPVRVLDTKTHVYTYDIQISVRLPKKSAILRILADITDKWLVRRKPTPAGPQVADRVLKRVGKKIRMSTV
jgi:hypothetical protein